MVKQSDRWDETDISLVKSERYYHLIFKDYGLRYCKKNTVILTRNELISIKAEIERILEEDDNQCHDQE